MNTPSAVSVLIADDEASIRNGLRSAVESLDLNLQVLGTARNGLEAWEFIQTYSPDLVITDIRMPICDGLELMKRYKVQNNKRKVRKIYGKVHKENI